MVDPKYSHRGSLSSRIALGFALLLAGAFGLITTFVVPPKKVVAKTSITDSSSPAVSSASASDTTKPAAVSAPAPAPKNLVEFCSDNVTPKRSFVIFRKGTCVVVNEPSTDPVGDALETLKACEDPEARFVPELTREGNLIVSFREPVFHNFTPEDREGLETQLKSLAPTLLTPSEVASAGDDWVPPTHAQFGLLARRRMLEDAAKPTAVKIIRAKQAITAGN